MMMWHGWYGAHWVGAIMMLLFWGLVGCGIMVFIRPLRSTALRVPDRATQVLRERFANGEISEEEYKHRLSILSS